MKHDIRTRYVHTNDPPISKRPEPLNLKGKEKMKCADVAKSYVQDNQAKSNYNYWCVEFEKCDDFPRDPQVVEFDIHIRNVPTDALLPEVEQIKWQIINNPKQLKGKKWKATFVEVIE